MILEGARVLIPFLISFSLGIILAPLLTDALYKYKVWKKTPGKKALDGTEATVFNSLKKEGEGKTPRMGGVLIWGTVLITTLLLSVLGYLFFEPFMSLDYLNRGQTYLPLAALLVGALVGLINDIKDVTQSDGKGLSLKYRLLTVAAVSGYIGWWFYDKLDISSIGVPLSTPFDLGIFFIPFFMFVALALYASGVIDGIDGLAGGIFAFIFMIYSGIAFSQDQIALAAFSAVVSGATFAFLWFNIPPARFWMTETGTFALTLCLAVVAFSTDTLGDGVGVGVLPIIAFPLTITVASNVLQIFWKKVFKKKLFRIAPIHHHFEALGWPSYKVVMRYWVITIIMGVLGLSLALMS
jgi:phospho-N-acetylmuramoyl-pentapeptide-transferase